MSFLWFLVLLISLMRAVDCYNTQYSSTIQKSITSFFTVFGLINTVITPFFMVLIYIVTRSEPSVPISNLFLSFPAIILMLIWVLSIVLPRLDPNYYAWKDAISAYCFDTSRDFGANS